MILLDGREVIAAAPADLPAEIGVGEHGVGRDDRPLQGRRPRGLEGRLALVGLGIDSRLGEHDSGLVRVGNLKVTGPKGTTHYWDEIHFARFNLEWLSDRRDSLK